MLQAGKYIAKATEIRATTSSKKGTLGITVKFKVKPESEGAQSEIISWTGWCTSSALPYTMEKLKNILDYNGDDQIVETTDPSDPRAGLFQDQDCINRKEPIELVLEEKEGRIEIKYINKIGGGNQFAAATAQVVKSAFAAVGFKAAFLSTKTQGPKSNPVHNEQANLTDTDVPF